MARRLKVSRASVLSAYEQLLAEGYVSGRKGSGTYVSDVLPALMTPDASIGRGSDTPGPRRQTLSAVGRRYKRFAVTAAAPSSVPFATGCCSIDSISIETWRLTARRIGLPDPGALAYTDPIGEPTLRQQIAEYLGAARAVNCQADQIVVLSVGRINRTFGLAPISVSQPRASEDRKRTRQGAARSIGRL